MTNLDQTADAVTEEDIHYGKWADLSLQLTEDFDYVLDPMVDQVLEANALTKNQTNISNQKRALSFLLSNLLQIHKSDPNAYCLLNKRNNSYPRSSYNPNQLGVTAVRRCFSFLRDNGFIEVRGGNFDRSGEGGRGGFVTRCRAQESLLVALSPPEPREELIGEDVTPGITGNTNFINDINSIDSLNLFQRTPLPIIRMKDENKDLIETPEHPDLDRMVTNLERINAYLDDHWIDLCIADDDLPAALTNRSVEENGAPGERSNLRSPYNLATQRILYRVFNNSRFGQGGRFYGGWWQQIKSGYRKFITINWHPVSEIDYSNMQAAMLYAREGRELPDDAYQIDGISTDYRKLIKTTFFKLINAEGQIRRPPQDELPDGWTFDQIMEALRTKHSTIADYFNTGVGLQLQRDDSDIAETVMLQMIDQGQLVLPVHDSFIIRSGNEGLLREAMLAAYAERTGCPIEMETDPIWFEEMTTQDDRELHDLDIRDISENMSDLIERPEYAQYNQRRWDFVDHKGEEWGQTRQWFNG